MVDDKEVQEADALFEEYMQKTITRLKNNPRQITVLKRNGSKVEFDKLTIKRALKPAFKRCKVRYTNAIYDTILENVYAKVAARIVQFTIQDRKWPDFLCSISVENIQNVVEEALMKEYPQVAKEYILYRNHREEIRHFVDKKEEWIRKYKEASNTANSTVDDNSNVSNKNIGILNSEIHKEDNIQISRRMVVRKLRELFPEFDAKQYERDLESHIIYKHDESSFAGAVAPYCVALTMYPFLDGGIRGIGGLSAKPKNLDSYCGMLTNMIFAVSAQFAGAVAVPEALLYFDYFARKEWGDDYYEYYNNFYKIGPKLRKLLNASHYWCNDIRELRSHDFGSEELNKLRDELVYDSERPMNELELEMYKNHSVNNPDFKLKLGDGTRTIRGQIHQCFQQIIYSINQPAAARGLQSAFVNFSYYDKAFFEGMFGNFVFPDLTAPKWESLNWLQKDFMQWFNAERLRCVLTFPVESFAMVYQNGKFLDPENARFCAQEYARGHSFFTYISDTVDSLSSCCRLKNKLQTKEFNFTNGNMGLQTGSKSVITLNLNRIIQDWANSEIEAGTLVSEEDSIIWGSDDLKRFEEYLGKILDRIYKYHTAYNELLWDMKDAHLLPVYDAGFIDLNKQYLTIGINGLNQAAEFLGIHCNDNEDYKEFCQTIFGGIAARNKVAGKEKFNGHTLTFNTEQVPAESLAVKNYNWDKEDGYWVPEDTNLYASYIFKPNDPTVGVFEKLKLHGREYIGDYLDGGAAAHINLEEHLTEDQYMNIINQAAEVGCNYFTFNIPMTECKDCGHIINSPVHKCPKCGSDNLKYWTRIIGYLTAVPSWSAGRQEEFKSRIFHGISGEQYIKGEEL